MSFLPAQQPAKPQCVAMRIRETDPSVFPSVRDVDLRRQEQERFANLPGKLNGAVLDKHYREWTRAKTDGELQGFTRCNGNIIAPPPLPVKPWEPKHYSTKESWQKSPEIFHAIEREKQQQVERAMKAKNYADNFTPQPCEHVTKAMIPLPYVHPDNAGEIVGFKGIGYFSPEEHHCKAQVHDVPAAVHSKNTLPPWLQEGHRHSQKSPQRCNPSMLSDGVSNIFGIPSQQFGYRSTSSLSEAGPEPVDGHGYYHQTPHHQDNTPSRGIADKGAAYPKEVRHKRLFHIADSTGGRASPEGAKMLRRDQTTSNDAYGWAARAEALAQGRASTSMLP